MKKFFPIYLVFVIASVLSVGQLMFNWLDLKAGATKAENKINSHYESIYSDLSFKTADGKKIVLNSVKAPIVVLNFWATWCQPCLSEFPSIVAMKKKYNDQQIMVFGINQDDEFQIANIKKATKKYQLNFPSTPDNNGVILEKFMISAIPVSIIYHKGKVIDVSNGAKDFRSAELYEKFDSLLKN